MSEIIISAIPFAVLFLLFFGAKENVTPNCVGIEKDNSKALKGFCAILVFLHHAAQKCGPSRFSASFCRTGFLCTALFFFLSGYGLEKQALHKMNYAEKAVTRKIPSVVLPYIMVFPLYLVPKLILTDLSFPRCLLDFCIYGNPIVGNGWYAFAVVYIYFSFFLSAKIAGKNNILTVILLCAFNAVWTVFCIKKSYGVWTYNTPYLFALGALLAMTEKKLAETIRKHYRPIITFFGVTFSTLFYERKAFTAVFPFLEDEAIFSMASSFMFVIFIVLLSMKVDFGNRILSFFGGNSLYFYLCQGVFVNDYLLRGVIRDDPAFIFVTFCLSTVLSFFLNRVCRRLL